MAKKDKTLFYCKSCGNETPRWEGKCPACGEWDALVEAPTAAKTRSTYERSSSHLPGNIKPKPLREHARTRPERIPVPLNEFSRVLGGGIVPGASVLVGGEPGIGKSTLLLQVLGALAHMIESVSNSKSAETQVLRPLLYCSGEEDPAQIAERGLRLSQAQTVEQTAKRESAAYAFDSEHLLLVSETDANALVRLLQEHKPLVAIVDSIQTMRDPDASSAPGAISQIRECAMQLIDVARRVGCTIFLIGHVTKEGNIAGPRLLEHMVDTVLQFEGDPRLGLRCLRSLKNRYGSTHEVGLFEMAGHGLIEVPDPSSVLLDRSGLEDAGAGSAVGALVEGTRVLLAELQALTVPVPGGGTPRRRASGLDNNRLAMLLAVLEAKAGLRFGMMDVFASAVGGFRIEERAADLPLALALASVASARPIRKGLVSAGEIGLGGELRPVPRLEARLTEAQRLGFTQMLLPARSSTASGKLVPSGLRLLRARTIREALALGLE